MKGNHGAAYAAVRAWVVAHMARAPDAVHVDKVRGCEERRELWAVTRQELGEYLAQEYGWPGVRWSGRVRRWRRRIGRSERQYDEIYWGAEGRC